MPCKRRRMIYLPISFIGIHWDCPKKVKVYLENHYLKTGLLIRSLGREKNREFYFGQPQLGVVNFLVIVSNPNEQYQRME